MKIGVKYCGGCNPHYERRTELEKLEKKFPEYHFEPAAAEGEYDKILLICGCTCRCIAKYREAKAGEYLVLKNKPDFEMIEEKWKEK